MNDEKLVEQMLDAFYVAGIAAASTFPYSGEMREHMLAALRVARKAITEEQDARWERALRDNDYVITGNLSMNEVINRLRARLAPQEPAPELCGAFVIHLIAGASWYPCALPKGHSGGHRAAGTCFLHGYYLGEEGTVPQCPQWPKCIESLTHPKQEPTAQERVTVQPWIYDPRRWVVLQDGWNRSNVSGFVDKRDAEIYADGLRYRLQKEAAALAERRKA